MLFGVVNAFSTDQPKIRNLAPKAAGFKPSDGQRISSHSVIHLTSPFHSTRTLSVLLRQFSLGVTHRQLSAEAVLRAREMRAQGIMIKTIAQQFGVSNQHMRLVLMGKKWKHV